MEKEVEQLKLTALNIRSVLTGGIANIKKIKLRRNEVDRKIEEKFELAKKDKELKETVTDVFNSILEDDDDELKDTLEDVFNSVRK